MVIAPIMATNTNSPAIAGTKYRSAMDACCVAAGAGVAGAEVTTAAV